MDFQQGVSVVISGLSLCVSIWSYRKTISLNRQVKLLNERKVIAEQYSFYVDSIHSEFLALKDKLSAMSSLCCRVNASIGDVLDLHDKRRAVSETARAEDYVKPLRHVFNDLHDGICEAFSHELPWQTVEHIFYRRLPYIARLDSDWSFVETINSSWKLFSVSRRDYSYPEIDFLRSPTGKNLFVTLAKSLDESKCEKLLNSINEIIVPMCEFLEVNKEGFEKSLAVLESGWVKNKLEEFKLSEAPRLRDQYQLFTNTLRFMDEFKNSCERFAEVAKYNPSGQIVALGATIEMVNWLVCETCFMVDK